MEADFSERSVTLTLTRDEYGFLFRAVNDRVCSLPAWEVSSRLRLPYEQAQRLLDLLLAVESAARDAGTHWLAHRSTD
jgi:hypothetical protein